MASAWSLGDSETVPDAMYCGRGCVKVDIQFSSSLFRWWHMLRLGCSEKYMSRNMFPDIMAKLVTLFCGVSSNLKCGS